MSLPAFSAWRVAALIYANDGPPKEFSFYVRMRTYRSFSRGTSVTYSVRAVWMDSASPDNEVRPNEDGTVCRRERIVDVTALAAFPRDSDGPIRLRKIRGDRYEIYLPRFTRKVPAIHKFSNCPREDPDTFEALTPPQTWVERRPPIKLEFPETSQIPFVATARGRVVRANTFLKSIRSGEPHPWRFGDDEQSPVVSRVNVRADLRRNTKPTGNPP